MENGDAGKHTLPWATWTESVTERGPGQTYGPQLRDSHNTATLGP
jgi:hypothetical protein